MKKSVQVLASPKLLHDYIEKEWTMTNKLVFSALLAAIAALLQSAGGFIPGVGYLISPFTTLPIIIAMVISTRTGLLSYIIAGCLLLLIEPTELFIFPFTTGLLGLILGWSFRIFQSSLHVVILSSTCLFLGICFPLYILDFPVFGPITSNSLQRHILIFILGFSFLYSFTWNKIGLFFINKIKKVIIRNNPT